MDILISSSRFFGIWKNSVGSVVFGEMFHSLARFSLTGLIFSDSKEILWNFVRIFQDLRKFLRAVRLF